MKNAHRGAVGAAALLAASLIGVGTASATTAPVCGPVADGARISSVQQLKASIVQAAAIEKQASTAPLAVRPMGGHGAQPPSGS